MKKNLLFIIFLFFCSQVCTANPNDTELSQCIKHADGSYSKIYDCTFLRNEKYQKQNEKLLKELKLKITLKDYNKIINNQTILSQYIKALNNGEIQILNNTNGLMYQTFAQEILLMINETNFQILSAINSPSILEKSLKETQQFQYKPYLIKLKNNLTPKQYSNIVKSQEAWALYKNDTIINILPMIQDLQKQEYIKQIINENRINTLTNINLIFFD